MKKPSLIIAFCLSALAAYAQIEFTAAMQWRNYEFESFDKFLTNYNANNTAYLAAPMPNLTYKQYPIGGVGFNVLGFAGINVEYTYFSATTAVDFKNKERREIDFSGHTIRSSFGIGIPIGKIIVKPYTYFEITPTTLKSRYVYADGTVSYSPNQPLNGIFRANVNNVGAGMRIIGFLFKEKLIGIMATADYGSILRSEPEVLENLSFTGGISGGGSERFKNGDIPRYFATQDFNDPRSYTTSTTPAAHLNQGLYPTFSFGIGLYYLLAFNED